MRRILLSTRRIVTIAILLINDSTKSNLSSISYNYLRHLTYTENCFLFFHPSLLEPITEEPISEKEDPTLTLLPCM